MQHPWMAMFIAGLVSVSAATAVAQAPATRPAEPVDPKYVYALGVEMGERLRAGLTTDNRTIDQQILLRGVIDGLNDQGPITAVGVAAQAVF